MKTCWKCKVEQPLENFARNRSKSSGHSAECKACVKAYNKRHVTENAEYYRQYRQSKRNLDLAWYLFLESRARAKRNGLAFNLEPSDIVIPASCPVFGFAFRTGRENRDFAASVDRIDCTLGYVKGNVRVISYLANRMKSNASENQLRQFALWVLEDLNGSARGVDPRQSPPAHSDQHAGEAADGSRTWHSGADEVPSAGNPDPAAQVAAGPVRH